MHSYFLKKKFRVVKIDPKSLIKKKFAILLPELRKEIKVNFIRRHALLQSV